MRVTIKRASNGFILEVEQDNESDVVFVYETYEALLEKMAFFLLPPLL